MNPLDKIPARYRWVAYVVLGLVFLAWTAWQAADGDWAQAVTLFLGSLGFSTAARHVDRKEPRRG